MEAYILTLKETMYMERHQQAVQVQALLTMFLFQQQVNLRQMKELTIQQHGLAFQELFQERSRFQELFAEVMSALPVQPVPQCHKLYIL